MKTGDWKKYINQTGDFEFPQYLYKILTGLMKTSLDLGTMICQDPAKLRAYKEQVKAEHRQKWLEVASALEFFDIIQPCSCNDAEFCTICGGSRFILSETMTAEQIREFSYVTSNSNKEISKKLELGMEKAMKDIKILGMKILNSKGEPDGEA